jgi:hypothetical protein
MSSSCSLCPGAISPISTGREVVRGPCSSSATVPRQGVSVLLVIATIMRTPSGPPRPALRSRANPPHSPRSPGKIVLEEVISGAPSSGILIVNGASSASRQTRT